MRATAHIFGSADRPNIVLGPDAPGLFYEISQDIKSPGKGKTMGPFYEGVKNKEM